VTVFKTAAVFYRVEYFEASGQSDLRQAHEVQLVGIVEIDEHLHSEQEQRRCAKEHKVK
jgi:hypothetical protein